MSPSFLNDQQIIYDGLEICSLMCKHPPDPSTKNKRRDIFPTDEFCISEDYSCTIILLTISSDELNKISYKIVTSKILVELSCFCEFLQAGLFSPQGEEQVCCTDVFYTRLCIKNSLEATNHIVFAHRGKIHTQTLTHF